MSVQVAAASGLYPAFPYEMPRRRRHKPGTGMSWAGAQALQTEGPPL